GYAFSPTMTLCPDDKALAAYLIENEVVSMRDVIAALEDAGTSSRDLGESLVQVGALAPPDVLGFRAEVARRALEQENGEDAADATLGGISPGDEGAHDDPDTWFDVRRELVFPG